MISIDILLIDIDSWYPHQLFLFQLRLRELQWKATGILESPWSIWTATSPGIWLFYTCLICLYTIYKSYIPYIIYYPGTDLAIYHDLYIYIYIYLIYIVVCRWITITATVEWISCVFLGGSCPIVSSSHWWYLDSGLLRLLRSGGLFFWDAVRLLKYRLHSSEPLSHFKQSTCQPVKTFCRPRSSSVSVFISFMLVTKAWHFCFHIKIVGEWMIPPNSEEKTSPCHLDAQEQQQQKLQEHPIGWAMLNPRWKALIWCGLHDASWMVHGIHWLPCHANITNIYSYR